MSKRRPFSGGIFSLDHLMAAETASLDLDEYFVGADFRHRNIPLLKLERRFQICRFHIVKLPFFILHNDN